MDKINLPDMANPEKLAQLIKSEKAHNDAKPSERDLDIADRLWRILTGTFGTGFTGKFGMEPTQEWIQFLRGLTVEQIKMGIDQLPMVDSPFGPSIGQFRALCIPPPISPDGKNSAAYINFDDPDHPNYKPKVLESDEIKTKRKAAGSKALSGLKDLF